MFSNSAILLATHGRGWRSWWVTLGITTFLFGNHKIAGLLGMSDRFTRKASQRKGSPTRTTGGAVKVIMIPSPLSQPVCPRFQSSCALFLIGNLDAITAGGGGAAAEPAYSPSVVRFKACCGLETGLGKGIASVALLIHRTDNGKRLESSSAFASIVFLTHCPSYRAL